MDDNVHPHSCEHCQPKVASTGGDSWEETNWEELILRLNHEWVVRLIKLGQAKIPKAGFYIFENPTLIPSIRRYLQKEKAKARQDVIREVEKIVFKASRLSRGEYGDNDFEMKYYIDQALDELMSKI